MVRCSSSVLNAFISVGSSHILRCSDNEIDEVDGSSDGDSEGGASHTDTIPARRRNVIKGKMLAIARWFKMFSLLRCVISQSYPAMLALDGAYELLTAETVVQE